MISAQELIERITAQATSDDCIVIVTDKTQANLRWANSTLTTNGVIAERSITIIAFVAVDGGMAAGSVSRTDLSISEIPGALAEAIASARAAGKAEDFAPLARNVVSGQWADPHQPTGPEVFAQVAPDLGEMFKKSVADNIELFGYAEHTHATTWIGSKGGIRCRHDQPVGRIEMTGKSHQRSRSTWEGVATKDFSNVSIAEVDKNIRQRLEWQGRKLDIPAGRYKTLLPGGSVSDLLVYMLWVSAARDAQEGRSVFSKKGGGTRIGEKISNVSLDMFSDPAYKGIEGSPFVAASASSPFSSVFDNGQKQPRVDWLRHGELSSLAQTRASAEFTKLPYTPLGDNLIVTVEGGNGSINDLVKTMDDGLLLTTLWYIRVVDPTSLLLTGLTRDGVYQVKNGEVIGAVNNFRWNESPVGLLSRIASAGSTQWVQPREWAGDVDRQAMPALIFNDFNMSTVSPAN